jgi:ribosomal protein S10
MNPQLELLKGPRISRLTLSRLHNLGNYEHVRYEITVEIPPGNSPASVLREAEQLLEDVNPPRPVSAGDLSRAHAKLKLPAVEGSEWDASERETARRRIALHEAWLHQREKMLARFDRLGGVKVFTDAKMDWSDDE